LNSRESFTVEHTTPISFIGVTACTVEGESLFLGGTRTSVIKCPRAGNAVQDVPYDAANLVNHFFAAADAHSGTADNTD
jgi:hypothetical protein